MSMRAVDWVMAAAKALARSATVGALFAVRPLPLGDRVSTHLSATRTVGAADLQKASARIP
jgi:hypothetical protein